LTTPLVVSALHDWHGRWTPAEARESLDRSGADLPALIAAHELAMRPTDTDWLQKRLRLLWKSSVVGGSLDATAWLHETGRLLSDIPQDILSPAIDEAVMKSERGFMPTVGEIRAIADKELSVRKTRLMRLRMVNDYQRAKPAVVPVEERCTPEEAAAIIAKVGLKIDPDKPDTSHRGPPIAPDAAWYRAHGIEIPAPASEEAA